MLFILVYALIKLFTRYRNSNFTFAGVATVQTLFIHCSYTVHTLSQQNIHRHCPYFTVSPGLTVNSKSRGASKSKTTVDPMLKSPIS